MKLSKPTIAVTMGDPAGVGPEICLRLFREERLAERCRPVVFGDAAVLERVAAKMGVKLDVPVITAGEWQQGMREDDGAGGAVVDLRLMADHPLVPGEISAETGRAGFGYVNAAIDAALSGKVQAVSTAPLNKEALFRGGIRFPGHTEIFAHRTKAERWCMMQYSEAITCTFVTVHVGYLEVPDLLTPERILEVIQLTAEALQRIRKRAPRIVVCGLNPHAGERGLFGKSEEERCILPAVESARAQGLLVEGPVPPDTAFVPAKRAVTDAFVCMYHDQGHIPVKALAFDSAVNTTLGLPIIRTSVDHGTALDIAWQGKANPSSLFCAVNLACDLVSSQNFGDGRGDGRG